MAFAAPRQPKRQQVLVALDEIARKQRRKLPPDLVIPACAADADIALKGWDASITALKIKAQGADIEASGLVADLMGKPKGSGFKARAKLDFPATKAEDVPLVKAMVQAQAQTLKRLYFHSHRLM